MKGLLKWVGVVAVAASTAVASSLDDILSAKVRYGSDSLNLETGLVEFINDKELAVQLILTNNALPSANSEADSVLIGALGGAFYEIDKKTGLPSDKIYTNMTVAQVGPVKLEAGETKEIDHKLRVALPPNTYGMGLTLYVQHGDDVFTVQLSKDKVIVDDEPISSLDPRLLIVQVILGVSMLGGGYVLSKNVLLPYLEGSKKSNKEDERRTKAKSPIREKSPESGSDSAYDEQWIPEHHLRPRKGRSGNKKERK